MKLQIINNISDQLNGFTSITIANRQDIKNIVHNSCTQVFAARVLDTLEYKDALEFLSELLQRVRLSGSIILSGLDLISLGQNIANELIDSESASNAISNVKSITDTRIITKLLESNGFVLEYLLLLDQNYYEIKATRVR